MSIFFFVKLKRLAAPFGIEFGSEFDFWFLEIMFWSPFRCIIFGVGVQICRPLAAPFGVKSGHF
ncbi:MAG: hypothetical protein KC777_24355 [Cyanobacteria bacterium HKST-UBA02]|nr:hypothetical protein [Cyanobacteria bacterium HKST-UBA02]